MPFDTIAMAAIADEVRDAAVGGQIQRIIQPSAPTVSLAVYSGGRLRWIVLSADPVYARVHLSGERLAKGFATPSSFIMLLRKYLEGSRLVEVEQQPYERVLRLTCGSAEQHVILIVEVMARHSNIVLVDGDGAILGALRMVPPRQSSVRPILPGRRYSAPPPRERDSELFGPGPRIDPCTAGLAFEALIGRVDPGTPIQRALMGLLPGAGPFLVNEIAARAGASASDPTGTRSPAVWREAAAELYVLYESRDWRPSVFENERGRRDFAPYRPRAVERAESAESVSAAVERCMGADESRDSLHAARKVVLDTVERARVAAHHRVASLQEGLNAATDAESVMQKGQLILAYQYLVGPRAESLPIPDMDMTIELDPRLTASENAEKAFRRYRKLRDAAARIPGLLRNAEREAARLDDLAAFVRMAESESDLAELTRSLERPEEGTEPTKSKRAKKRGPARFTLDGHTILVGRHARENEEVTFRLARRDDLWLHARERTGAHVILHVTEQAPPEDIVQAAAGVAAYFSEGRTDSAVDVDVARVKDVRKIPGGPPGRVTYRGARTVRTAPGMGAWTPSKSTPTG